jgi:hypothetical protein
MKSLIWKEWRENFKWTPLPSILILGPMIPFGVPMLLEEKFLAYVSLVAAMFGALLGFLQAFSEARGDKRSMLMHRPLSPSRIFLGKVIAGMSLYLFAILTPTAIAVVLAAMPGHVAAPFEWGMALPWLADVLTGLVYYFAGILVAQREARWYGSRCLPLAAGLFTSLIVWNVVEFWHAIVVIGAMSGLVALAAWGSTLAGGVYEHQPRWAKLALGGTLLSGLLAIGFGAKVIVAMETLPPIDYFPFEMGRRGDVLIVKRENGTLDGRIQSITDLACQVPAELTGERLDAFAFRKVIARGAMAGLRPKTISYRSRNRFLLEFKNATTPSSEAWWFAPAQGRFLGYDKTTKHLIGSFGPGGFADPGKLMGEKFNGGACSVGFGYDATVRYPLAFPDGAYTVDFRKGIVQKVFSPPAGETVVWASQREDEREKWFHMFVGTEKMLHVFDDAGTPVCSATLPIDLENYRLMLVGRFDNPRRYGVWYIPDWQLPLSTWETMNEVQIVIYDAVGNEILPRKTVPPRSGVVRDFPGGNPLVGPSSFQAVSGLGTSGVELAVLVATRGHLESEARSHDGLEASLPLQFLSYAMHLYIPGICWDWHTHSSLVFSFAALMLLAALASGLACYLMPRRYAFSPTRRRGWAMCGLLFGPTGLLLMFAMLEWPALIACPKCRKLRVVSRETCEHCGSPHALPEPDGTEIFESDTKEPKVALTASH